MENSLLTLKNLEYSIEGRKILYDVNLSLQKNSITTLIGPNGAGKTTLLKIIVGLLSPTSGALKQAQSLKIGYVPQKISFSPFMPLRVIDFLKLFTKDLCALEKWATILNIGPLYQTQMHALSGGELQRVLLLQGILQNPDLLVLDEPAQGVDMSSQAYFYGLIDEVRKILGCTVLLVSHDLHLVMAKSDQVFCLNHHICCSGHPEDVRMHPEYLKIFGDHLPKGFALYHHHHDHEHT